MSAQLRWNCAKSQGPAALAQCVINLHGVIKTVTLDNGTVFHDDKLVEQRFGVPFYFATLYNSWERESNEKTNGLIRQYLPEGKCQWTLTQAECEAIAIKLNNQPRKRPSLTRPTKMLAALSAVAFQM